jgi:hypothetical protein
LPVFIALVSCPLVAVLGIRPGRRRLFGTAHIGPQVWLAAGLFALVIVLLEEARNIWVRRRPAQAITRTAPHEVSHGRPILENEVKKRGRP